MVKFEWLEQFATSIVTAVAAGAVSFVIWVVRVIFTNQKKVDALNKEIGYRDQIRQADSKRIEELHKDVRELREWIKK